MHARPLPSPLQTPGLALGIALIIALAAAPGDAVCAVSGGNVGALRGRLARLGCEARSIRQLVGRNTPRSPAPRRPLHPELEAALSNHPGDRPGKAAPVAADRPPAGLSGRSAPSPADWRAGLPRFIHHQQIELISELFLQNIQEVPPTTAELSFNWPGFNTAMPASAIASSLELLHFTTWPFTPASAQVRLAFFSRLLMAG